MPVPLPLVRGGTVFCERVHRSQRDSPAGGSRRHRPSLSIVFAEQVIQRGAVGDALLHRLPADGLPGRTATSPKAPSPSSGQHSRNVYLRWLSGRQAFSGLTTAERFLPAGRHAPFARFARKNPRGCYLVSPQRGARNGSVRPVQHPAEAHLEWHPPSCFSLGRRCGPKGRTSSKTA